MGPWHSYCMVSPPNKGCGQTAHVARISIFFSHALTHIYVSFTAALKTKHSRQELVALPSAAKEGCKRGTHFN